uniref:Basal body orientation factor 1 n=1 Tax=Aquila chrysaetos chrysaetos TaxID=223781 RepID=A0A663DWT3_AQUCH
MALLTKRGQEKAEEIEKLKQELIDLKQQAQEEMKKLADYYAQQIKELEEKFQKKVGEIGQIQLERKLIKEFCRGKASMEKELEDKRLEEDVEKKQIMMAETAQCEAVLEKIQFEKVDISELTWEQKERVLRLLFAKMNGTNPRKYNRVLATSASAPDNTKEESKIGTENASPNLIFITQQANFSDSSSAVILPHIQMLTPQTE